MWPSVREDFPRWVETFEGRVPWIYLDSEGLPTTGVGNLLSTVADAQRLPWLRVADGSRASSEEIASAYETVRAHQELAGIGGGQPQFAALTSIRLAPASIDELVASKLAENERALLARFPGLDAWPAPAQEALFGMAWALGPARFASFPRFTAAANALDFATAATESHISNARPARNDAHRALFEEAADVLARGLPRDVLSNSTPPRPPPDTPPAPPIAGDVGGSLLSGLALMALVGGALYFATRKAG